MSRRHPEYIRLSKFSHLEQLHCHFYDVFLSPILYNTLSCPFFVRSFKLHALQSTRPTSNIERKCKKKAECEWILREMKWWKKYTSESCVWYAEKYGQSEFFHFIWLFLKIEDAQVVCFAEPFVRLLVQATLFLFLTKGRERQKVHMHLHALIYINILKYGSVVS